jgi:uncharacterized protein YbaP (TraB family)
VTDQSVNYDKVNIGLVSVKPPELLRETAVLAMMSRLAARRPHVNHAGVRCIGRRVREFASGASLLTCFLAFGCIRPTEHPLLWVVEGERPAFIYGTIHLPDARVLTIPPVVRAAFDASDVVYTEITLDRETEQKVEPVSRLPEGQRLQAVLPPELYKRTARYFRARGVDLEALADRKVWFIAATVGVLDCVGEFLWRPPLDKYFWTLARWRGKETAAIETMDEQIAVFESLTIEEQVQQLEAAVTACERAAAEGTSPCRKLVEIYLRGDEDELEGVLKADAPEGGDDAVRKLMFRLVNERNVRMADRIAGRLRERPELVQFFAVGAGHLVGADGVVARLSASGFRVRRLGPDDLRNGQLIVARDQ